MLIGILLILLSVRLIKKSQISKNTVAETRAQKIGELGTRWVLVTFVLLICLWAMWYGVNGDLNEATAILEKQPNNMYQIGELAKASAKITILEITAFILVI